MSATLSIYGWREKVNKLISFRTDDFTYDMVKSASDDSGFAFLSEFMRGLVGVMFNTKFSKVETSDLNWIKYLYVIGIGVNKLLSEYKKSPDYQKATHDYLIVMTNGINNLIDAVALTDEYNLPVELEGVYVDAINIFFGWLDRNDLTEYNVTKLAEKLKQVIKYK